MSAVLIDNKEDARHAYRRFIESPGRVLAFDTETTGLEVRNGKDMPRTIQFSWRPWEEAVVFEVHEHSLPVIEAFFEAAEHVVGHNVKFDIHAMANVGVTIIDRDPETVHDTLWLARMYDERTSGKLKDLGTRYLRADAAADQQALKRKMRANGWDWATV